MTTWQIAVNGDCDPDGRPRGAYVEVADDELVDYLTDNGFLDDGADDIVNKEYDASNIFTVAIYFGIEEVRRMYQQARERVLEEAVNAYFPVLRVPYDGVIGRAVLNVDEEGEE